MTTTRPGLRERKKERTRQALVNAALTLFDTKGYEETTIADLAEAADISPRTFFGHFASKDEVLFADPPLKLDIFAAVLAEPRPGERPAALLLRGLAAVLDDADLMGQPQRLRADLILRTPALQIGALRKVLQVRSELVRGLLAAYPDELDLPTASALVGSFVGALIGGITTLYADADLAAELTAHPERMPTRLETAIRNAFAQLGDTGDIGTGDTS
jgi:AcrR family transcriptional regulator